MTFVFDNTFAREMEGCYVPWKGAPAPEPRLLRLNEALAAELGLDADALRAEGAAVLSGVEPPAGADPLAQAYAGHQFGGFSPQLGDGRALLLGEVIDIHGRRRDIQLKGSGRTPFSRGGDGKAALGPVLREYLVSEAMHALGVPTTRALAAVATGDMVYRETALPGAVLTRVAASHLRVGSFQYLAARGDTERLRKLADYAIARHDPDCAGSENPYLALLNGVRDRQASLIARWMGLGFIHGVMNTDNMTISGETIDFGPCAFMDVYDPATVFSSIDTYGRYAYGAQPAVAQWNLARLAEALLPLIDEDTDKAIALCTEALERFPQIYAGRWLEEMGTKLGLTGVTNEDFALADGLLEAMKGRSVDYTRLFRALSDAVRGDEGPARALFDDPTGFDGWLPGWRARLAREERAAEDVAAGMDRANPVYIPRNYHVEAALTAAVERDDMAPFDRLAEALARPFDQRTGFEDLEGAGPEGQPPYRTFCGT